MLFLLIASVMIMIAFLIVLPPLWRKHSIAPADQDQRNIAIARQRLAELKEQLQAGALSQELYNEQLAELELALSDDLDTRSQVKTSPTGRRRGALAGAEASQSSGRWMASVLIFAIPLMAGSFYWALGNYQLLSQADQPVAANQAMPEMEQIRNMVGGLAERLQEQPDDALGWTMLGRSYKYLQQYPKAVDAFEHAYKLIGDKPEIMLLYADALAYANNEQMAGLPTELVFKALAMEPNNVSGLWLGGMAKAQTGDFAAAMDLWKKLEAQLPAGSDAQKEIQGLLAKLAAQIPEGAAQSVETGRAGIQPTEALVSIDVQVSLAPELQTSAAPNDTVFIYAQALSGPKMPLAIVRKQVSELPLTVGLTDAMAMMPNMKLSNFEQVKLLARVSKSGDAMQQPGDLIGTIEPVSLADKGPHKIVINSQIK
ncbi:c-type cytochrome biogenesis protein CcmI [Candidatus Methylobacter oryzae]|uniref:C-type cytochrome biogenesis protein CcmI n=2 Tax=Candidatus Methylobacter oryzae TaxID=2497749 RepID=A0ABY3CDT1_9GAMM|nr:c-type cytochrome biogenesis protein CcmI [Candidatus Methylobacter oryzae]TRX00791.1 c-type cytochrome biogenesis protein CcmI [Candidatus Methylobacter oryzae]